MRTSFHCAGAKDGRGNGERVEAGRISAKTAVRAGLVFFAQGQKDRLR